MQYKYKYLFFKNFFITPTSLKNTLTNTKMMKEKKNEKLFKIKLELQFGK
jgi:hypothetical protein